jgi:hypothetical protein
MESCIPQLCELSVYAFVSVVVSVHVYGPVNSLNLRVYAQYDVYYAM